MSGGVPSSSKGGRTSYEHSATWVIDGGCSGGWCGHWRNRLKVRPLAREEIHANHGNRSASSYKHHA